MAASRSLDGVMAALLTPVDREVRLDPSPVIALNRAIGWPSLTARR